MEAWQKVKANQGSAGVDKESIGQFEKKLKNNLYKLWNRMSSGSYFPPPVKRVYIDKSNGGKRPLGIPTVSDRVAQMVCKILIEPYLEKVFHPDSYGYRPNKSAQKALGQTRIRCLENAWVLDLDIKGFFDTIDHELMMKAVRHHIKTQWIVMYIERWLKTSVEHKEGRIEERTEGTPQGGVISPLLANLYLHYALDMWLVRNYPQVTFERYADDCVIHCVSENEAKELWLELEKRLKICNLVLHPEKTKIVYCKDSYRRKKYIHTEFDFLGYTFKPRKYQTRSARHITRFLPAISKKASKEIKQCIKKWEIRKKTGTKLEELAKKLNPIIRGWINYYGLFYKTAFKSITFIIDKELIKWIMRKYKKYRRKWMKAYTLLNKIKKTGKPIFAYW